MQRIDLDLGIGNPGLHSQIVHPNRWRAFRCHAIRALVEDLQSHVFQHRQAVGESHRRAKTVELEPQRSGRRLERPIERHPQRLGLGEFRYHLNVRDCGARGEILAVRRRKGSAELPREIVATGFAHSLDQRLFQIVGPAPRDGGEPCFEIANIEARDVSRCRAYGDQNPGKRRLRQVHVEFGAASMERLGENGLPLLAQLGCVVLPRRVDQARQKTLEWIATHEQPETLPLAQMQDTHRGMQQIVLGDLEQLVAGVGLENVAQRLVGVASGDQPRARDDVGDLAPQQRDVRRLGAVRGRREQAQKPIFSADLSLGVEALDRDVIEIARPVHR